VRVARKEDKLKIKDEYNNYRVCLRYFFNVVRKDFFVGGWGWGAMMLVKYDIKN
jgi:hypothetical protein